MKDDDVAIFEAFLKKLDHSLTSALGDARQVREVLDARRRRGEYDPRSDSVLPDLIDDDRFTVRWNGGECRLGWTVLFRLFRRLALSANQYVTIQRLLDDVWSDGDERTEDTTVRSAVRNLRRKLEAAGMAELAEAIQGTPGHYGLMLEGVARKDGLHREGTAVAPPVHSPLR